MESIIDEGSPLASYLEGTGEASTLGDEQQYQLAGDKGESASNSAGTQDAAFPQEHEHEEKEQQQQQQQQAASFAPSGTSTAYAIYRKRIPQALRLRVRSTSHSLSRLHRACSGVVKGRLGPRENATFLERFRYTIIASDLLSEHHHGQHGYNKPNGSISSTTSPPPQHHFATLSSGDISRPIFSTLGAIGVAGAAFVLAGSIAWARSVASGSTSLQLLLMLAYAIVGLLVSFAFARRKWLQHVRAQALDDISAFVSNAQAFDAALSTAVTIVQEVELVARGYRISHPLPPVSRLDDQGQRRRCARLRTAAHKAARDVLQPLAKATVSLERQAVTADLERYHDIYEITRADVDEVEQLSHSPTQSPEDEDGESLRVLKLGMHQLFMARKLLLCILLALDADGTTSDYSRWSSAAEYLQALASGYLNAAVSLDSLLSDEERFASPTTPKMPLTPGRERARAQIRKLGGLSSGIRGLQAKMHMLREEADQMVNVSEDGIELGQNLLMQYEAIGADLRVLLQEWEEGRAALTSSNKRRSVSSAGLLSPRAETPTSLSGSTAIGGSPADAFRVLNGEALSPRLDAISSDEEVFEAVAMPRQRSTLSREERIAKMREDREVRERTRESRQANTNMLRELETVLKYKPQQGASKSARRVTVM